MEIIKADLKDIDALIANRMEFIKSMRNNEITITDEFRKNTYEYMKKHIEEDSMVIFIAVEEGVIVSSAMVCYYQLLPNMSNQSGKTGYIQNVYTLLNYRGRGLASELMNKIKLDAKDRNVGKLLLNATDMGRPVYEKLGFEDVTKDMFFTLG